MIIGLVPFSAQYLFQRVFYAFGDARTPFWVQVLVIALWTAGNLLAASGCSGRLGVVVGIGLAMSVANLVGAGVLAVLDPARIGGIDGRRVLSTYVRCAWSRRCSRACWLDGVGGDAHVRRRGHARALSSRCVAGAAVLLVVYVAGLEMLRVRELDDLAAPVRRFVARLSAP